MLPNGHLLRWENKMKTQNADYNYLAEYMLGEVRKRMD